jgi:hypothetical protein
VLTVLQSEASCGDVHTGNPFLQVLREKKELHGKRAEKTDRTLSASGQWHRASAALDEMLGQAANSRTDGPFTCAARNGDEEAQREVESESLELAPSDPRCSFM